MFGPKPTSHTTASQRRGRAARQQVSLEGLLSHAVVAGPTADGAVVERQRRTTVRAVLAAAPANEVQSLSPLHLGAKPERSRPASPPNYQQPKARRNPFRGADRSGRLGVPPPRASATAAWRDLEELAAAAAIAVGPDESQTSLVLLPTEVLMALLSYLHDPADLARCSGTCRLLRAAAGHDDLWEAHWRQRWELRPPLHLEQVAGCDGPTTSSCASQRLFGTASLCLLWQRLQPAVAEAADGAGAGSNGGAPCPRAHHVAVAHGRGMLVHGGWSDRSGEAEELHHGVLCDTHWLRRAGADGGADVGGGEGADGWTWWRPVVMGAPPRRSHHAASLTPSGDELLVCGGWDGFRRVPHVHVLDLTGWRWTALRSIGEPPAGLSDFGCVSLPSGPLMLVGRAAGAGASGEVAFTDRWELQLEQDDAAADAGGVPAAARRVACWTSMTRGASRLEARTGHSVELLRGCGKLLVLGGRRSALVEQLKAPPCCAPPEPPPPPPQPLWSGLEAPMESMAMPPPPAARPSASSADDGAGAGAEAAAYEDDDTAPAAAAASLERLWRPLLRHFPCHGADARAHAQRLFYDRVVGRQNDARAGESGHAATRAPRMEKPQARRHHASVAVGDELVLLHGGEVYDAPPSHSVDGATYLLHVPTLRWAQPPSLFVATSAESTRRARAPRVAAERPREDAAETRTRLVPPPRRCGHTAVAVPGLGSRGCVLMFGGQTGADGGDRGGRPSGAVCGDVWMLEL